MLKAWRGARPALRAAWEADKIPYYLVKELAAKPGHEQSMIVVKYLRATQNQTRAARGAALKEIKKGTT